SPVMANYLSQLPNMNDKKFACFVTQHFPKPWMGGNRAVKQMLRLIEDKGGKVIGTGNVNWTNKAREEQINDILIRMSRI
ncbi:MAG: hypothetical protein ACYDEX_20315, partial [Mobilitalea sp.]